MAVKYFLFLCTLACILLIALANDFVTLTRDRGQFINESKRVEQADLVLRLKIMSELEGKRVSPTPTPSPTSQDNA